MENDFVETFNFKICSYQSQRVWFETNYSIWREIKQQARIPATIDGQIDGLPIFHFLYLNAQPGFWATPPYGLLVTDAIGL